MHKTFSVAALIVACLTCLAPGFASFYFLVVLSIALAFLAINANEKRLKRANIKHSSLSNIFALFAIIIAVGVALHGPFGPEMMETRVRRTLGAEHLRMRNVAAAIESFKDKTGAYPPQLLPYLTTPVSFLEHAPLDGFSTSSGIYGYVLNDPEWFVTSAGPDKRNSPALNSNTGGTYGSLALIPYDPTNGIQSEGDVILSRTDFVKSHSSK